METRIDFVQCLEMDVSLHIMSFLDDPADIVRASIVSRLWHQFVIANKLAKRLCLKIFPDVTKIVGIPDTTPCPVDSVDVESNKSEWEILERDQKLYASLLQALTKSTVSAKDCIANAISASSTDNYPDESVVNTLNPRDRFIRRASYWSSKGQSNPDVPETLIYKLRAGIWLINEIDIQPFEAFFQPGNPIYSVRYVRFRLGHPQSPIDFEKEQCQLPFEKPADDKFVWTYVSPAYPMLQENKLQPFKLPEPVLCIGGYLQIELLGRVQRQEMDRQFYICVCYVRVMGRPLYPAFDIETVEPDGKPLLKFYPENLNSVLKNSSSSNEIPHMQHLEEEMLWERMGLLEDLLRGIQQGPNPNLDWNGILGAEGNEEEGEYEEDQQGPNDMMDWDEAEGAEFNEEEGDVDENRDFIA